MSAIPIEWKLLRGGIGLLLLATSLATTMIWGSLDYRAQAEKRIEELEKTITKLRTRKNQDEKLEQILVQLRPRYEEFRKMGSIGEEPRLLWVEAIQDAEKVLKLPAPIRFKLDPPQPFTSAFATPPTQEYLVLSSRMELTLGLLHEGDLLNLIHFLQQKKVGIMHVNRCRIQQARPLPEDREIRDVGINLEGSCSLDWLTLRERSRENG
ncbi:MAG: hypothetical protein HQL66_15635 [Magnetococcales bacterium]|nr:hypothetical protein [Magnetococcales bacterium]